MKITKGFDPAGKMVADKLVVVHNSKISFAPSKRTALYPSKTLYPGKNIFPSKEV